MSTAIVWFRRDLRVHDLPALAEAAGANEHVLPLFVFDPVLLGGRFRSAGRTAWMLDALRALDGQLRERGGRLAVRHGRPEEVLPEVAAEVGAAAVHVSEETTGFSRGRDDRVAEALGDVQLVRHPGVYIADLAELLTKDGRPYTVFSPFARAWRAQPRRTVRQAPREISLPPGAKVGRMPSLEALGFERAPDLLDRPPADEESAKQAATRWLRGEVDGYGDGRNVLAQDTSRLSVHLRFGTLSPLWLEERVTAKRSQGASRFRTELAWRDFYGAVLLHHPEAARTELQERYRGTLEWDDDEDRIAAWKAGETGYPVVDAAMRQLRAMGWMHNRARMIVASFLTKDLHIDWRVGEAHFMEHLLDGDVGSNNGGWQWVASTGTDPAPYFQRLFNPTLQQGKFDPEGRYVRRFVPELSDVPLDKLAEPWTMSEDEQEQAGCVIGRDYPAPIVDHATERRVTIERYRAA
jgi:deoxyribodipyrimidine photo-lyase